MTIRQNPKPDPIPETGTNNKKTENGLQVMATAPTSRITLNIYRPHIERYKLKMLIYGPPGVGKTSLLATAGLHKLTAPILLVNIEGGMLSVADSSILGLKEPPDVVDLKGFSHLEQIFWYLAKGDHPYKSVGIDSLSELQMVNLEGIVGGMVGKIGRSGAKRDSLDDVWLEDYGTSTQQLRRVIRQFRDLPLHVFAVCADAMTQDKDKNETIHPALTPKLRNSVMAYMDVVGYQFIETENEKTSRRLLCQPYGKWTSKDRSPGQRLGLVVEAPTIPKIMDLILGKK